MREAMIATLVVLALLHGAALDPLDIHVGGPLSVHIKSNGQGQVSSLLLLLTTGSLKVNNTTPDISCQQPKKSIRNCAEVQQEGHNASGLYVIKPYDCCPERLVQVYCDMDTDGGGWTLIQRRDKFDVQENFYRPWLDYVNGFGNLQREFWLGLDNIHALTDQTHNFEARFDLGDFEGSTRWAKYDSIYVGDANSSYTLTLGAYTGDAGNAMDHHTGRKFSTLDKDNDDYDTNCATIFKGAWWYGLCHNSNLNGEYLEGDTGKGGHGIIWQNWRGDGYSLKKTEIKIRPKRPAATAAAAGR